MLSISFDEEAFTVDLLRDIYEVHKQEVGVQAIQENGFGTTIVGIS